MATAYNPVALVADVMALLGAKDVATRTGVRATTAVHAAADLLRALGVDPAAAPTIPTPRSGAHEPGVVAWGADRLARPGETCTCGKPAVVVYETQGYGDLGYCGEIHG